MHAPRNPESETRNPIAIIGLGYVGLPLAVGFGRQRPTLGFDSNADKIQTLQAGSDPNGEVAEEELKAATQLHFSADAGQLEGAGVYIITVPTPVGGARRPDLAPLLQATRTVGRYMGPGATVIFESTVYPGCTEEVCIPELERASKLKWKRDFSVAYSPERINPGDSLHSLSRVTKVVGADTDETLARVAALYETVVEAGVHRVSSIPVAEAAKVIENTQRDLNIALMNELALIFHRLNIDTREVLDAAGSKWNFLPFKPGLVGGHCIGVDPYYLTYKAEMLGYHPQVVLAGRRINDQMGRYVAEQAVKAMIARGGAVRGAKAGVLGFSFKENTADVRNTRVADLVDELTSYEVQVCVHDPVADRAGALSEHGVKLMDFDALRDLDVLIIAVAHREFLARHPEDYIARLKPNGVLVDVQAAFDAVPFREAGIHVWRL